MSRRKYIVTDLPGFDKLGKEFINVHSANIKKNQFGKVYLSFVVKYVDWIKEQGGFYLWKNLVDKLKINRYDEQCEVFFQSVFNASSLTLYWMYKHYEYRFDSVKTKDERKKIIFEFNQRASMSLYFFNPLSPIRCLLSMEVLGDLKLNSKSKLSKDDYKFILIIAYVERVIDSLKVDIKNMTINKMIKFIKQDKFLKDYLGKVRTAKYYTDYKSRNKKDWNGIYREALKSDDLKNSFDDTQFAFLDFLYEKYPSSLAYLKN